MWIAAITLLFATACAVEAALTREEADRLANAIYRVEGGSRTRYPYGIKSVRTSNPRAVCLRTIQNAHDDWLRYGRPHGHLDFLAYLGRRYCPPEADPHGHRNWLRNMRSILQ